MTSRRTFPFYEGLGYIGTFVLLAGVESWLLAQSPAVTFDANGNTIMSGGLSWQIQAGVSFGVAVVAAVFAYAFWIRQPAPVRNRSLGFALSTFAGWMGITVFKLLDGISPGSSNSADGSTFNPTSSPLPSLSGSGSHAIIALTVAVLISVAGLSIVRSGLLALGLIIVAIGDAGAVAATTQSTTGTAVAFAAAGALLVATSWLPPLRRDMETERRWDDISEFLRLIGVLIVGGSVAAVAGTNAGGAIATALGFLSLGIGTWTGLASRGVAAGGAIVATVGIYALMAQVSAQSSPSLELIIAGGILLAIAIGAGIMRRKPAEQPLASASEPAVVPTTQMPMTQAPHPSTSPVTPTPAVTPQDVRSHTNDVTTKAAVETPPRGARISDDKHYWWDPSARQWKETPISPDGYYYFDGTDWQLLKP